MGYNCVLQMKEKCYLLIEIIKRGTDEVIHKVQRPRLEPN